MSVNNYIINIISIIIYVTILLGFSHICKLQTNRVTTTIRDASHTVKYTYNHNHHNQSSDMGLSWMAAVLAYLALLNLIDSNCSTCQKNNNNDHDTLLAHNLRTEYFKYKILEELGLSSEPKIDTPYPSLHGRLSKELIPTIEASHNTETSQNTEATSSRSRRSLDCGSIPPNKSACCREPFYVNFTDIGWDKWILHPPGYYANYCKGRCDLSHARYYHSSIMSKFSNLISLCCSPKRMSQLTLMYLDEENKLHQKIMPDMTVESCDCS